MTSPTQRPVPTPSDDATARGGGAVRAVAAYLVVALAPLVAWVGLISHSDYASDQQSVAWFVTVALACVVAGALAPPLRKHRLAHRLSLSAVAVVAAVLTLFGWWSAEDESGLFMVGIVLATPPMLVTAPALLLLGGALGRIGRG